MLSVIWKELKVLFSKKFSIIILLVYPLLLVYLLGVGFSGHDISFNIGLSQVQDLNTDLVTGQFKLFGITPTFFGIDQSASLLQRFTAGFFDNVFSVSPIFVFVNPLAQSTYYAKIYYEDLDFFVGKSGVNLTENALLGLSNKISLEKITEITNEIKNLRVILIEQKDKLQNYNKMLDDSRTELLGIKQKLDSVNFTEIKQTLNDKQKDLNNVDTKLDELKKDKEVLEEAYNSNKELVDLIDSIYFDLGKFKLDLATIKSQALLLSLALTQLNIDKNTLDLNSFLNSTEIISQDLNILLESLGDANTNANKSSLGLGKFVKDFNATFNLIEEDVNDTNVMLINLQNKIVEVEQDFTYVNSVVDNSLKKQAEIKEDLNKSIVLMDSLILQLDPAKFDPEAIANPIKIEKESRYEFFKSSNIAIIFGIVLVLLFNAILLVSMSGVKDKTQGIDVREKLAPRNRFWFFMGRFFAQSIVGIMTAIVMFLFAILVFGFPLQNVPILLVYLILSIFSFVSVGLFIGLFVESESIAILLSLLIVMPMLFLSGLILPIYFMPQALSAVASILPLTLGKNALINAIVGKSATYYAIALLAYTVVFLSLVYIFRKR
ncbi:MAG: hypothetical protein COT14_03220 [Candidatus Diapherotrites archaeon CG08_land_8_20_14_0_20_30_16]|nr:MAG: hypothetical protein COT14_03220 [Candidatus Diapherotrites archaeon CG08_land_8_20_14_0_20_30_16]